jgi:hypothetical protein
LLFLSRRLIDSDRIAEASPELDCFSVSVNVEVVAQIVLIKVVNVIAEDVYDCFVTPFKVKPAKLDAFANA